MATVLAPSGIFWLVQVLLATSKPILVNCCKSDDSVGCFWTGTANARCQFHAMRSERSYFLAASLAFNSAISLAWASNSSLLGSRWKRWQNGHLIVSGGMAL